MTTDLTATAKHRAAQAGVGVVELSGLVEGLRGKAASSDLQAIYAIWVAAHPADPLLYAALYNYSVVLTDAGELTRARECLERSVSLNPDFAPSLINLGRIHERLGIPTLALRFWSTVIDKLTATNGTAITHKVTALNQAARVLEEANQDAAAESMLYQSLDADPHQHEALQHYLSLRQRQCKWPVVVPWARVDRRAMMRGMSPLSAHAYTDDPLLHLALAANFNQRDVGTPAAGVITTHRATRNCDRLRIGYLSSDLRGHAVGHLMAEVFELHDRARVEVFAYYCGAMNGLNDPLHARFKASADHWVPISHLDDETVARKIEADGIHILIDLNGYTKEGRTRVVAMRPAPVIVNWLGYPGTMGSPYHHYIIADEQIIPKDAEIYYSEKVVRLPCYQPNDRKRAVSPRVPTRAEAGLPDHVMVYCCFNATHKITRFTFDRWLAILRRVPDSVLWLLEGSPVSCQQLRAYAGKLGITSERLVFAKKLPSPEHLARHRLADLFLDTAPYGAHTTCSDALWMGVPVLTWAGRSFASRVCGSLVAAAGLPELVCPSADAYVEHAVKLGRDRIGLQQLRDRLIAGRPSCVLFDMPLLIRHLEKLYAVMWRNCAAGTLPRPDLTNLDAYLEIGEAADHEAIEVGTVDDYRASWVKRLSNRHAIRPIHADRRLCTWATPSQKGRRPRSRDA